MCKGLKHLLRSIYTNKPHKSQMYQVHFGCLNALNETCLLGVHPLLYSHNFLRTMVLNLSTVTSLPMST